jgi:hypothetical protein
MPCNYFCSPAVRFCGYSIKRFLANAREDCPDVSGQSCHMDVHFSRQRPLKRLEVAPETHCSWPNPTNHLQSNDAELTSALVRHGLSKRTPTHRSEPGSISSAQWHPLLACTRQVDGRETSMAHCITGGEPQVEVATSSQSQSQSQSQSLHDRAGVSSRLGGQLHEASRRIPALQANMQHCGRTRIRGPATQRDADR